MKRKDKPRSPAEIAKRLGITQEQLEAQARKQADEFFRKKGLLGPELTPREKEELEKQARAATRTFEKDFPRNPDWPPFPLPDIYDDDDPHLVSAAHAAIREFRRTYVPAIGFNGKQLKAAVEVALAIQSAWSNEGLELREVPLAKNSDWPTEQDFVRLEQWFVYAQTAIAKEIASGGKAALPEGGQEAPNEPALPAGNWSRPMALTPAQVAPTPPRPAEAGTAASEESLKSPPRKVWSQSHCPSCGLPGVQFISQKAFSAKPRAPSRTTVGIRVREGIYWSDVQRRVPWCEQCKERTPEGEGAGETANHQAGDGFQPTKEDHATILAWARAVVEEHGYTLPPTDRPALETDSPKIQDAYELVSAVSEAVLEHAKELGHMPLRDEAEVLMRKAFQEAKKDVRNRDVRAQRENASWRKHQREELGESGDSDER